MECATSERSRLLSKVSQVLHLINHVSPVVLITLSRIGGHAINSTTTTEFAMTWHISRVKRAKMRANQDRHGVLPRIKREMSP